MFDLPHHKSISKLVKACLEEDIKTGDITAQLTPEESRIHGKIIAREAGIICGIAWVNEVFKQIDNSIQITWYIKDGQNVRPDQTLCIFEANARPILTGERSALNILQTLSGTATITNQYVQRIAHTKTRLLDTRKTLPAMRDAQKYAVLCGGGVNHRIGLYDGILIKENHLRSSESLENIVKKALKSAPSGALVELEVETLEQLKRGLQAGIKRVLLDNFSLEELRTAVTLNNNKAKLEASGNVTLETIANIAETGVHFISSGAITKHVKALDLSMLFDFK